MGLPMTSPSKPAFTAGPARVVRDHPSNACAYVKGATGCELATLYGGALDLPDQASRIAARDANAELIAEAFTVAHETGLTPRQLAERLAFWLDFAKAHIGSMDADELEFFETDRTTIAMEGW